MSDIVQEFLGYKSFAAARFETTTLWRESLESSSDARLRMLPGGRQCYMPVVRGRCKVKL